MHFATAEHSLLVKNNCTDVMMSSAKIQTSFMYEMQQQAPMFYQHREECRN